MHFDLDNNHQNIISYFFLPLVKSLLHSLIKFIFLQNFNKFPYYDFMEDSYDTSIITLL